MKIKNTKQRSNCNTPTASSHEQLKKAKDFKESQRKDILSYIEVHGHINTIQAHQMAILAPAARILELRRLGYPIETISNRNYKNGMATYVMAKSEVNK